MSDNEEQQQVPDAEPAEPEEPRNFLKQEQITENLSLI
jgi:hypothetical protein